MRNDDIRKKHFDLGRREMLLALGGTGVTLATLGTLTPVPALAQSAFDCVLSPEMTEGPYWVDEKLNRSDIRIDPSDGTSRPGTPLTLAIRVHSVTNSACALLPGAYVDIWHCDAGGLYSDESANNTVGKKYLRGYQVTDSSGLVNFTTIYPGWYSGRAVHIHLRIRTYSGSTVTGTFTSQLFFDDSVTDQVFTSSPYSSRPNRDTRNATDNIFNGAANSSRTLLTLSQTSNGYAASIDVGVNLTSTETPVVSTTTYSLPQFAYGGGWYSAVYLANTSDAAATATVNFVGQDGSAMSVPLNGIGTVTSQSVSLPRYGTVLLEALNSGSLGQGWVELLLPAGVIGYGVFRQSIDGRADQEAVVPLTTVTSQTVDMIYDDAGFTTAVAVVNPSSTQATFTLTAVKDDGTQAGTGSFVLPARSQVALTLRALSGMSAIAGTRGRVRFATENGAAAILGLRFGAAAFTSIPVSAA